MKEREKNNVGLDWNMIAQICTGIYFLSLVYTTYGFNNVYRFTHPTKHIHQCRNPSHLKDGKQSIKEQDEIFNHRSQKWILLVDDEESIRQAIGQYLFDQGYQVTACADAETAWNICMKSKEKKVPDLIVSDICMPTKQQTKFRDGLDLLRKIRETSVLAPIPVILLTAKGSSQDRIAGYNAGADAYIPKPFDPEELLAIVDTSIERHEILNGSNQNINIDDIKQDIQMIKQMLLEEGGAGVGSGWIASEAQHIYLTPMERNLLQLLCQGKMNKEMAMELFLSQRRVEQLITTLFRKTDTSNRTELVRWAISTGITSI